MTSVRTIDVHTHILTDEAIGALAGESPKVAPAIKAAAHGASVLEIAGQIVQDPFPREIRDVDLRLADMDRHRIDVQVLAATVFTFFYQHEPSLGLACSALQNEHIAAVVRRHPSRFAGLATVPLQAPDKAAAELERAMRKLGLRGAMIGSHVNGRNLDDPALAPFWSAAAELGAFIFIHPHAAVGAERLKSYYLRNLVGLPFETTIAGASLVFGGVLDRHPGLKVCLSHGGGFVPYQAGRFRHGWEVRPEARTNLQRSPEESLARLHYDTILHSRRSLEFLVDSVGPEHVLLGSDYPFDMGSLDCVGEVEALSIAPHARDLILGGRATRLLDV